MRLQAINKFSYNVMICRVITKVQLPRLTFFSLWFCDEGPLDGKIIKFNSDITSELISIENEKRVPIAELYGKADCCANCRVLEDNRTQNLPWLSCQIKNDKLFQIQNLNQNVCRILTWSTTGEAFSSQVRRQRIKDLNWVSLCNIGEKFVFAIGGRLPGLS